MRFGTKSNIFHRLGLINHQVQMHRAALEGHQQIIEDHTKVLGEILDSQLEMATVVVKNSELADYIAQFATDMAGLLVDLMADVNEMGDRTGNPHIAERIDARAEIAGAMLKLQNERITNGS